MNHYQVLNLSRTATQQEIRKAYRELVQIYHPDRMRGMPESVIAHAQEKLKVINRAYSVLTHPQEREHYDLILYQKELEEITRQKMRITGPLKLELEPSYVLNERWESLSSLWSSFIFYVTGKRKQFA